MVYNIGFFDPKFSMITMNHKTVPRAYILLNKYMGDVTIQLEVREGTESTTLVVGAKRCKVDLRIQIWILTLISQ